MKLTKSEKEVAELITRGYQVKEIAAMLFKSPRTVTNQRVSISKKWNAPGMVDIARVFILQLDEPKKFFLCALFIAIQGFTSITSPDMPLRRPARTRTKPRTEYVIS